LFVNPGPLPRIVPTYLRYFAKDFHPDEAEASDVVERWKAGHAQRQANGSGANMDGAKRTVPAPA
jgi:predicted metal-dependent hydrolase